LMKKNMEIERLKEVYLQLWDELQDTKYSFQALRQRCTEESIAEVIIDVTEITGKKGVVNFLASINVVSKALVVHINGGEG